MIRRCVDAGLPEPEFVGSGGFVTTIRRVALAQRLESGLESELESELESGLESGPTSLGARVLSLLVDGPMSKAELSRGLGQKQPSGPLHAIVRQLVAGQMIELTRPDKPRSRLQKYRLTDKGRAAIASLQHESDSP